MKCELLHISSSRILLSEKLYVVNISFREGFERTRRHSDEQSEEAWMSGLNQQFTKLSYLYRYREFESHRLRKYKNESNFRLGYFCLRRRANELLHLHVRFERLFHAVRRKSTRRSIGESHRLRKKRKPERVFLFCGRESQLLGFRVRFEKLFVRNLDLSKFIEKVY